MQVVFSKKIKIFSRVNLRFREKKSVPADFSTGTLFQK